MKTRLIVLSTFIFLALNIIGQVIHKKERDPSLSYFPNSVNDQWTYEIIDEINKIHDTVVITIINEKIFEKDTFMIWEYKYSDKTDTYYVSKRKDSIKVINSKNLELEQLYLLPFEFELNYKWFISSEKTGPRRNWNKVIDVHNIMIGSTIFSKTVMIEHNKMIPNDYLTERIWFKPYFGIVKIEKNGYGFSLLNKTWKIIDWNIKNITPPNKS